MKFDWRLFSRSKSRDNLEKKAQEYRKDERNYVQKLADASDAAAWAFANQEVRIRLVIAELFRLGKSEVLIHVAYFSADIFSDPEVIEEMRNFLDRGGGISIQAEKISFSSSSAFGLTARAGVTIALKDRWSHRPYCDFVVSDGKAYWAMKPSDHIGVFAFGDTRTSEVLTRLFYRMEYEGTHSK
jgi:hypothetical protein